MKDKALPKKPPAPKPHPKGYKPTSRAKKENEGLRLNWENCRPMFWQFQPSRFYYFPVVDKRRMVELLSEQERNEIRDCYQQGIGKRELSDRYKAPYDFISWFLDESERDEFKDLRSNRKNMTIPERMDRIVAAMVTELEIRLTSCTHRKGLETTDLVRMVKNASSVQKTMEEGDVDTGTVMTVVSHMPKKGSRDDDDDDETVH